MTTYSIAHGLATTADGLSRISIFLPSVICILSTKAALCVFCQHPPRKRGGGASSCSLSFKETCTESEAVFEEVKTCGKWASDDPFKAYSSKTTQFLNYLKYNFW